MAEGRGLGADVGSMKWIIGRYIRKESPAHESIHSKGKEQIDRGETQMG